MEKRIARITRVDTVLNVVDRKLELGFLVLTLHHYSRRDVRKADSGISRVHGLSSRA